MMRIFILTTFLLTVGSMLFAQKRLKDSIAVLNQEVDSMKTLLADARREAKKSTDLLNLQKDETTEKLSTVDSKIKDLTREKEELIQRSLLKSDSLENALNTAASFQKIISDNALLTYAADNRAKQLVRKLKDSLVDFSENMCYIYSKDGDVFLVLSDSLIFGPNFYLSNRGKQFLEKFIKQLVNEPFTLINIKTFANPLANKQDIWIQANNRSRQLTSFFEMRNFPFDRYIAQSSAAKPEHINYKLPPVIFEILLK